MNPALLTLFTFLAVVLAVIGVYSLVTDLFLRDRSRLNRRMEETFRVQKRDEIRQSSLFRNLQQATLLSGGATDDRYSRPPTWGEKFVAVIAQSGVQITPKQLIGCMVVVGLLLGVLVGFLVSRPPFNSSLLGASAFGIVVGTASAWIPFLVVSSRRKARLNRLLNQLPDAFDLMARILRAGQSVPQAMQAVANEGDQPLASEFGFCYEQQNLGLSNELSLRELARRTGLLEVKILTLALLVQQESGGNLAELLDRLAGIIRERIRLRGKIAALTAEGRLQAAILLILPLALLVLLIGMSPIYAEALFENPWIFVVMVVSEGIGAFWIYRIVNFDF